MLKEQFGKLYSLENCSEVGIYKRKQESKKKKERKHALDQESDQEKKEKKLRFF